MSSKREAKRILRAFGKEEGKARISYVDSFLPEKTSFVGSISYRHTLRKIGIVVLLMLLILAMTVSAYAAVMYYLNYTRIQRQGHDDFVSVDGGAHPDGTYDEIAFYEPTYIPDGFTLESEEYIEEIQEKDRIYLGENGNALSIMEFPDGRRFSIDNETSTRSTEIVGEAEVVVYRIEGQILAILQYDRTIIMIDGTISLDEIKKIILGLKP